MLKTKIVEMPESISNPSLKCPHQGNGGLSEDVEIKAEVDNDESSRLMAALQGPGQPNSNTKGQWQLLQCSAFFPLWDYRYVLALVLVLCTVAVFQYHKITCLTL